MQEEDVLKQKGAEQPPDEQQVPPEPIQRGTEYLQPTPVVRPEAEDDIRHQIEKEELDQILN